MELSRDRADGVGADMEPGSWRANDYGSRMPDSEELRSSLESGKSVASIEDIAGG